MKHNKLQLAGDLLTEAAKDCRNATCDRDYAKSILLSGAVVGIVAPLLEELGIEPFQLSLAKGAIAFNGHDLPSLSQKEQKGLIGQGLTYYRLAYNALKHAGGGTKKIKPSEDLEFERNLGEEAYHLVDCAIIDYNKIPEQYFPLQVSDELRKLLADPWYLPAFDVEPQTAPEIKKA
jgi:hypothetical protein